MVNQDSTVGHNNGFYYFLLSEEVCKLLKYWLYSLTTVRSWDAKILLTGTPLGDVLCEPAVKTMVENLYIP